MPKHLFFPALLLSFAGFGQAPAVLKDSGLKKLVVFIGTWRAENDPDSAGKVGTSAIYTCQWSPNGNYLVADQRVTTDHSTTNNLSIYSYNPKQDEYTLSLVGIPGMEPFSIRVTYKGDELYYLSDYTDNNKKVFVRTVNRFLSPSSYLFLTQFSDDGVNWKTTMQGRANKVR